MEVTDIREASARVVVALVTAGSSRTTIKRYEAEFNAFAGFLEARGQALPSEADCLDFIAERSGSGSRACASRPVPGLPNSHAGRCCC
jgi:integrase/recombinase XerD